MPNLIQIKINGLNKRQKRELLTLFFIQLLPKLRLLRRGSSLEDKVVIVANKKRSCFVSQKTSNKELCF